jgi:hypothetical protein
LSAGAGNIYPELSGSLCRGRRREIGEWRRPGIIPVQRPSKLPVALAAASVPGALRFYRVREGDPSNLLRLFVAKNLLREAL